MDVDFPCSVRFVDLSQNNLEEMPSCITSLSSLRSLDLSGNKFQKVDCYLKSNSLEHLILSGNKIEEVHLVVQEPGHNFDPSIINLKENFGNLVPPVSLKAGKKYDYVLYAGVNFAF